MEHKIVFLCRYGTRELLKGPFPCKSSCQRASASYVAFTSIVEFSGNVEFSPSNRSGGRAGRECTDDTVILIPGGRAFSPVAMSPGFSYKSGREFTYQRVGH